MQKTKDIFVGDYVTITMRAKVIEKSDHMLTVAMDGMDQFEQRSLFMDDEVAHRHFKIERL